VIAAGPAKGWTVKLFERHSGTGAGTFYATFLSPTDGAHKCRSIAEVMRYNDAHGIAYDAPLAGTSTWTAREPLHTCRYCGLTLRSNTKGSGATHEVACIAAARNRAGGGAAKRRRTDVVQALRVLVADAGAVDVAAPASMRAEFALRWLSPPGAVLGKNVRLIGGEQQCAAGSFGVVAQAPLSAGRVLRDSSVMYCPAASPTALAAARGEIPQRDWMALGGGPTLDGVLLLRRPGPDGGEISLTALLNAVRRPYASARMPSPNVELRACPPKRGVPAVVAWHILDDGVAAGEEITIAPRRDAAGGAPAAAPARSSSASHAV
jgi:hypothetical protein